ncbi:MAG: SufE family protein [Saccharospirillum sp.]
MSTEFGVDVTADDIVETLSFFDAWEDRYRYIIDLGKELPEMDDALKTDDRLVRGCQSQVWLEHALDDGGHLHLQADSDAHIVKGLLAVVLAAYNGKTSQEILDFDVEDYFARLDLVRHLSPTRGNGLRAMVRRIRETAA